MGVVAVIHDLSMAVRCFPRLILLDDGMVVGDGPSIEVLSVDTIKRVFRGAGTVLPGSGTWGTVAVVSNVEEREQSHGSGRVLLGAICVGGTL